MKWDLRDGIGDELNFKISLKLKWFLTIIALAVLAGVAGTLWLRSATQSGSDKIRNKIVSQYKVRRHFDGQTWGTFWRYCRGWVSADHVHTSMTHFPKFVKGGAHRSDGKIDAVWYGRRAKCAAPSAPETGQAVYLVGYPGGSDEPALRAGKVYLQRQISGSDGYERGTWVAVFDYNTDSSAEPVVGGMSGGIVTDTDLNPLGILVTQNSPSDLNNDGVAEQSADFVGLNDVWDMLLKPT